MDFIANMVIIITHTHIAKKKKYIKNGINLNVSNKKKKEKP